jgi:hypothetical protein
MGTSKDFIFLNFLSIYFVVYKAKEAIHGGGGVELRGEQKNLLWCHNNASFYGPCGLVRHKMSYFYGAPSKVRHRKAKFCGA